MVVTGQGSGPMLLTGGRLSLDSLVAVADQGREIVVAEEAWRRVDAAHEALMAARETGDVYGANTGVGANRATRVTGATGTAHALRLLRSHCAGVGPLEPRARTRAALVVRLNQILVGGSGVSRGLATGLAAALNRGALPEVHGWGGIGTADLTQLAEVALTLVGERAWQEGHLDPVELSPTDALPFMSSSAFTLARAVIASQQIRILLDASAVLAALSSLALRGSAQAWDHAVHRHRPHPGQVEVARKLHHLVTPPAGEGVAPARLQDPFGLRAVPQVLAPAADALDRLETALGLEINSAVENPLISDTGVLHHGQFHLATVAALLDQVRAGLVPVLSLVASRLSMLMQPGLTGLTPFLSDGTSGASGLMIAEYVAQDALATSRTLATPTTGATLSISLNLEEHASFATQGARQLGDLVRPVQTLLALEAVAAVRALRMDQDRLIDCPARQVFHLLADRLPDDLGDRPMDLDLASATAALPVVAGLGG